MPSDEVALVADEGNDLAASTRRPIEGFTPDVKTGCSSWSGGLPARYTTLLSIWLSLRRVILVQCHLVLRTRSDVLESRPVLVSVMFRACSFNYREVDRDGRCGPLTPLGRSAIALYFVLWPPFTSVQRLQGGELYPRFSAFAVGSCP